MVNRDRELLHNLAQRGTAFTQPYVSATAKIERAALAARLEALRISLARGDGPGALLQAGEAVGVIGTVASLLTVESGYERGVAAARSARLVEDGDRR